MELYNWNEVGLIYDGQTRNVQMAEAFMNFTGGSVKVVSDLLVNSQTTVENLSKMIQCTLQFSNVRVVVVMASSNVASMLLSSANDISMGQSGYFWLFNSEAMLNLAEIAKNSNADLPAESLGVIKTGSVGILAQDASYLSENPLGNIISLLSSIAYAYKILDNPTGSSLYEYLLLNQKIPEIAHQLSFDNTGVKIIGYNLLNIQSFIPITIGY